MHKEQLYSGHAIDPTNMKKPYAWHCALFPCALQYMTSKEAGVGMVASD